MDPNETLREMLELAKEVINSPDDKDTSDEGLELALHFENLHRWIASGGFLPKQWSEKR